MRYFREPKPLKNLDDDDFINVLRDLDPAALEEYEQLKENEEILPMTPEALRELLQSYATDEKIEAMINDSEGNTTCFASDSECLLKQSSSSEQAMTPLLKRWFCR